MATTDDRVAGVPLSSGSHANNLPPKLVHLQRLTRPGGDTDMGLAVSASRNHPHRHGKLDTRSTLRVRAAGACAVDAGSVDLGLGPLPPIVCVRVLACLPARELGRLTAVSVGWAVAMPAAVRGLCVHACGCSQGRAGGFLCRGWGRCFRLACVWGVFQGFLLGV
jgi:hypothetical protein